MHVVEQTSLFQSELRPHKLPQTQYLGSKQRLVKWIFESSPRGVHTVLDAFSGSSAVGYHYKSMGKRVLANDFLKFNFHISKAFIENDRERLDNTDLSILLSENGRSGNLIENTFTGVFFERDQSRFLDMFRANVETLKSEYKQSLALSIACRALTRKVLLGHFAHLKAIEYSKTPSRIRRNPSIAKSIRELFLELINPYNNAVFDNNQKNEAFCEDAIQLCSRLKNIDLVYFDPPYCGCHPDYQSFYHFLETFVEYWVDKNFVGGTRQYFPKRESGFVQKSEMVCSLDKLFASSTHIPHWLISYNSKSYPCKSEMVKLIEKYKKVIVFENEYVNDYGGKGSRRGTREYLFYCHD